MKTLLSPARLLLIFGCAVLGTSCTTSYDAYGNPRQSVDPGVALMGVAAAGLVGYALANDSPSGGYDSCNSGGYYGNHYGSGYGYGGGYGSGYGYGGGYSNCY